MSTSGLDPVVPGLVDLVGDGIFDRIADLARFLLNAETAIVDLSASSKESGFGISLAPQGVGGLAHIADPIAALKLGFTSQASVPIRAGQDRIGTLAVVSKKARTFDARDVETLRRLAELVAEGVSLRTSH